MYQKPISPTRTNDSFFTESLNFPDEEKSASFSYNLSAAHSYHSQSSDSIPYVSNDKSWRFEGFSLESDDATNFLSEYKASPTYEYSSTFGVVPARISISSHSWASGSSGSMTSSNISSNPFVNTLSSKEVILSVLEFVKQQQQRNSGDSNNNSNTMSTSLNSENGSHLNNSIHQLLYDFPNLNSIASNKRITKLLFEKLQLFPAEEDGTPMDYLPSCGAKTNLLTLGINDFVVVEKSSSSTIMHIRLEANASHPTAGFSMNIQNSMNVSDRENNNNQSSNQFSTGAIPIPIPSMNTNNYPNPDPYATYHPKPSASIVPHRSHKLQSELLHLSSNSHAFFSSDSEEDSEDEDEEAENSSEYSSDFHLNARQSSQESNADMIQCFRTDTDEKLLRAAAATAVAFVAKTGTTTPGPVPESSPKATSRNTHRKASPPPSNASQIRDVLSRYPGDMTIQVVDEEEEEMYVLPSDEEVTPAMFNEAADVPFVPEDLNYVLSPTTTKKKGLGSKTDKSRINDGDRNNSSHHHKKRSSNSKKTTRARSSSGSMMITCRRPGSERWRVAKQLLANANGEFISLERVSTNPSDSKKEVTSLQEPISNTAEKVASIPLNTSSYLSIDTMNNPAADWTYKSPVKQSPMRNNASSKQASTPTPAVSSKEFPLTSAKKLQSSLSTLSMISSPVIPISIANNSNAGGLERRHTDHPDYYSSHVYGDEDEEYLTSWSGRPTRSNTMTSGDGSRSQHLPFNYPFNSLYGGNFNSSTSSRRPSTNSSVNGDYAAGGGGLDSANSSSHGPPSNHPSNYGNAVPSATSSARSSGTGMQLNLSLLNPHSSFNIIAQFSPSHALDRGGSVRGGSITGGSRSVYEDDEEEMHHGVWVNSRSNTPSAAAGLSKATSMNSIASMLDNYPDSTPFNQNANSSSMSSRMIPPSSNSMSIKGGSTMRSRSRTSSVHSTASVTSQPNNSQGPSQKHARRRARTSSSTSVKSYSSTTSAGNGSTKLAIQDHNATVMRLQARKMLSSSHYAESSESSGLDMDSDEDVGSNHRRHRHFRRGSYSSDEDDEYDDYQENVHSEDSDNEDSQSHSHSYVAEEDEEDNVIKVARTSRQSSLVQYSNSANSSRRPSGTTGGSGLSGNSNSYHTMALLQAAMSGVQQPGGISRRSSRSSTTGSVLMSGSEYEGIYYDDTMSSSSIDDSRSSFPTVGTLSPRSYDPAQNSTSSTSAHLQNLTLNDGNSMSSASLDYSPTNSSNSNVTSPSANANTIANKKVGFFTRMLHSIFSKPPPDTNNTDNSNTNSSKESTPIDINSGSSSDVTTPISTEMPSLADDDRGTFIESNNNTDNANTDGLGLPPRRRSFFGSFLSSSTNNPAQSATNTLPSAPSTIFEDDEEQDDESWHNGESSHSHSSHRLTASMGNASPSVRSNSTSSQGGTAGQGGNRNSGRFLLRLSMASTNSASSGPNSAQPTILHQLLEESAAVEPDTTTVEDCFKQLEKTPMESEGGNINTINNTAIPIVQNLDTGDVFPLGVLRYEPCIVPPTVSPAVLFQQPSASERPPSTSL